MASSSKPFGDEKISPDLNWMQKKTEEKLLLFWINENYGGEAERANLCPGKFKMKNKSSFAIQFDFWINILINDDGDR